MDFGLVDACAEKVEPTLLEFLRKGWPCNPRACSFPKSVITCEIAVGHRQWIAGLNSGLTADSFEGAVMWKEYIPAGEAVPYSLIHGIGRNSVNTRSRSLATSLRIKASTNQFPNRSPSLAGLKTHAIK